jgi:hypothetical protein
VTEELDAVSVVVVAVVPVLPGSSQKLEQPVRSISKEVAAAMRTAAGRIDFVWFVNFIEFTPPRVVLNGTRCFRGPRPCAIPQHTRLPVVPRPPASPSGNGIVHGQKSVLRDQ